jgi:hypothetical protein
MTDRRRAAFAARAALSDAGAVFGLIDLRDYLQYALSLPITVVGIGAVSAADDVMDDALAFKPLATAEMKAVSERCQVFSTTGYWVRPSRTGTDEAD